ncbi:hypothetical protein [Methanobacterium sp.]|uniref:hypothetical protein n=1 Tax=Methanobacterium sp. TaxID=2164 RepID=UPI003C72F328
MDNFDNIDMANDFLDAAYKCKPDNLEPLLQKIELEIKNSNHVDKTLLRAKTVVTSKLALHYSK